MDRWKSRGGKSQRREEKRREEERRSEKRKSQKKEDAGARKGRKVARHCVFPMICGSKGSKSRLAKAAGAEPSGQMRDEQLHAVVARSTFRCQNIQSKLRCWKSAHPCGTKHICKSKVLKTDGLGALLEVDMSKKCTPLWRKGRFEVKMLQAPHVRTTFGRSGVVSPGRRKGLCTWSKVSKTWGVCSMSKNDGRHGAFEEDLDEFRVAGAIQETCSSEMFWGLGADFLRGVAFWSIRSSVLLRWFCVTGAALRMTWHHFFVAGAIL